MLNSTPLAGVSVRRVAARLRYVAGTRLSTRKYLDMTRLAEQWREKMIENPAQQNGEFTRTQ